MEDISKMANKQDLIAEVAAKTGLTKKDSEKAVNAFGEVVTEFLAKGEKVQLIGFGNFEVRERAARVEGNDSAPIRIAPCFAL